jgi:hypothetical protein
MGRIRKVDFKPLKRRSRRLHDKFLLLLSNQVVIIDTEWEALITARKKYPEKRIVEMLPTKRKNIKSEVTTLNKLLEQNDHNFKEKNN